MCFLPKESLIPDCWFRYFPNLTPLIQCKLAQLSDWLIAPRILGGETIAQSELICKQVAQELIDKSAFIHWQLLHIPLVGISSSLIRNLRRDRQPIRYLVPEAVRIYIANHNLYTGEWGVGSGGSEGSRGSKGSEGSRGSRGSKGSEGSRGSKGSY